MTYHRFGSAVSKTGIGHLNQTSSDLAGLVRIEPESSKNMKTRFGSDQIGSGSRVP